MKIAITATLDPFSLFLLVGYSPLRVYCLILRYWDSVPRDITCNNHPSIEEIRVELSLSNPWGESISLSISFGILFSEKVIFNVEIFSFFGKIWDPLLSGGLLSHSGIVFLFFFCLNFIVERKKLSSTRRLF